MALTFSRYTLLSSLAPRLARIRSELRGLLVLAVPIMIAQLRAADYSKFDKTGLYTVCTLDEVDQVITNAELDEGIAQKYRDAGLDIVKVQ